MQRSGRKCSRSRAVRVSESLSDSVTESRASGSSISSSDASTATATATSADRGKVAKRASPSPLGWPIRKAMCSVPDSSKDEQPRPCLEESKFNRQGSKVSDIDLMVKRFAKLLLGEDMSGSGKGVCAALAISNAITNLCGTVFGQLWRLEPMSQEKKSMWQREMEWLLCVSDHIVEFIPSCQTFPDGTKLEVMTRRPRSDLFVNIPALRKLDNMLLDILDSFRATDFWYIDQGIIAADSANGSAPLHKPIQRQADKWWLPVPRVPPCGLHDNSRKQLHHKRDCANQILKAALAINSAALADMEVPESYLETLPKNGKACLGDAIYRYITSDHFSSECLLDFLDLSSEHVALEIANRVEASIYVWRRRSSSKPIANLNRCTTKSSWEMVKDFMVDGDKRGFLAERAAGLLLCLKQQFPGLNQTTLDTCKIQCNKDVGKSILESYSRILESVAFNIVARIDDLLYVDDLTKHHLNKLPPVPRSVSVVAHEKVRSPYSALTTPRRRQNRSPGPPLVSPATGERTPFLSGDKSNHRGFGVRRALTSYLGGEIKTKSGCGNGLTEGGASSVSRTGVTETPRRSGACRTGKRSVHQQNLQKL